MSMQLTQLTSSVLSYSNLRESIAEYERKNAPIGTRSRAIMSKEDSNPKLLLGSAQGYATLSLSLSPANTSGIDICPKAGFCRRGCVGINAGHSVLGDGCANNPTVLNSVRSARIERTRELFGGGLTALMALQAIDREIGAFVKRCAKRGVTPSVRMNAFSDILWEKVWGELFERYSTVQFYDYTKIASRIGKTPSNYHLTFSRAEDNESDALSILQSGYNVAVVFGIESATELPKSWNGYTVIDGTATDLRFLDPKNSVVGLSWKGPTSHRAYDESMAYATANGFAVRV